MAQDTGLTRLDKEVVNQVSPELKPQPNSWSFEVPPSVSKKIMQDPQVGLTSAVPLNQDIQHIQRGPI